MRFVDVHFHVPPDYVSRKQSARQVARETRFANGWTVFKSHMVSTLPVAAKLGREGFPVSGSFVFNQPDWSSSLKQLEQELLKYRYRNVCCNRGARPIIYFPTKAAAKWNDLPQTFVDRVFKIATEWDCVIATGHLGRDLIFSLSDKVSKDSRLKLLVTHATHPIGGLTESDFDHLGSEGNIYFEVTDLTYRLGRADRNALTTFVQRKNIILSSDHGQPESPSRDRWPQEIESYRAEFGDCIQKCVVDTPYELLFERGRGDERAAV